MKHLLQHFKTLTKQPQNAEELKGLILQLAIQGKLTENWRRNNPNTESSSVLLKNIEVEKERLIAEKKIKKEKAQGSRKPTYVVQSLLGDQEVVAPTWINVEKPNDGHLTGKRELQIVRVERVVIRQLFNLSVAITVFKLVGVVNASCIPRRITHAGSVYCSTSASALRCVDI